MRLTVRRALAAVISAGAISAGLATPAAAQPSYYKPVIRPCSHQFRTPLELPRPGTEVYWSPWGTGGIVCFFDGTATRRYYQRDPFGAWHDMNQLTAGNWFYVIFDSQVPNQATWG